MIEFEYELSTERRKSGSAGAEVEPAAVVLDRKANNGLRWLVEVENVTQFRLAEGDNE
jgi:hypothetical protein